MLEQLKNFDAERHDPDSLVELSALGGLVQAEYKSLNAEEPEWIGARLREVRREIRARQQDRIEKLLRENRARLEALKPAEERRVEIAEKIKQLEALREQI